MKYFLIVFLGFNLSLGFAQTNKKKVLVVPYGRFEFNSDFTLEEIGEKNNINANQVYNSYQKEMMNSFSNYVDDNFEFKVITNNTFSIIKKYLKKGINKYKGKKYYASIIKSVPDSIFDNFMKNQHTNFVVFINWYSIKKSVYISLSRSKRRTPYSTHFIDFDIYNLFKQKLFGEGEFKLVCNAPSNESLNKKLLDLNSLKVGYTFLVSHIIEVLNSPINNK